MICSVVSLEVPSACWCHPYQCYDNAVFFYINIPYIHPSTPQPRDDSSNKWQKKINAWMSYHIVKSCTRQSKHSSHHALTPLANTYSAQTVIKPHNVRDTSEFSFTHVKFWTTELNLWRYGSCGYAIQRNELTETGTECTSGTEREVYNLQYPTNVRLRQ